MALRQWDRLMMPLLREIYADAVESQAPGLYSSEQVQAWAALAWLPGVLDRTLSEGTVGSVATMRRLRSVIHRIVCRCSTAVGGRHGRVMPAPC